MQRYPCSRFACVFAVFATAVTLTSAPAQVAAEADPTESAAAAQATLIRLPLPIQGTVDTQVKRTLDQVVGGLPAGQSRPIVVLEFWPPVDGTGTSSEFGRSLDLARYLASPRLSGVRTVAYLPKTIRGHAVLVAIACEEIIMHPDAQIGAAGIDEENIDPTVRRGYSEIADRRRTIPAAVALGLLDPKLQVQRLTTATGDRYALADEVEEIQESMTVQAIDTVIQAGQVGLLSGDRLRLDYKFVSHLASDRAELARALGVPARELEIDPSFGGEWQAIQVDLQGTVTTAAVNRVIRGIEDRLRSQGPNFICVSIDSAGGSLAESVRLANFLADLDSTKLRTVAYVRREARADASLVALACDQLVMHPEATIGGPGATELDSEDVEIATESVREIMSRKSRTWSLPMAMIDPLLTVHRYKLKESTAIDFFSEEELQAQRDRDRWEQREEVTAEADPLQLSGTQAVEFRLARATVDGFDGFKQQYQLEISPEVVRPNWAHELVSALASPQIAGMLLFIGGFALIAELSAPGIGVGGFVSALCFILFFWANFLQGTAGWLEVILFVTGIFFIAMEVFILPGFGIFGLGGGTMVLASLVLASQTFVIPRNDYQMDQLPRSMFTVIAAMGGVITSAVLLRKYLEQSPLFRRVMLVPPEGAAREERDRRESIVQYDHLIGQKGRCTTPLTPAGKADFEGRLVDVVSDGEAVPRGADVVVLEVAGNRVVVRQADANDG